MIEIEYIEVDTAEQLALVKKDGIAQTLIPQFDSSKHKVFINNHFDKYPDQLVWQIVDISYINNRVTIRLSAEVDSPLSFGAYGAKSGNYQPSKLLRKGEIVDVYFGYRSDLFSIQGTHKNSLFSNAILDGELHKKRPSIVLSVSNKWKTAQVIPLSTKSSPADKYCIELPESTFDQAARHYREKTSYALLDMVQTVSWHRIYPVRGKDSKFIRHNRSILIEPATRKLIETNMAKKLMPSLTAELNAASIQIQNITKERNALRSTRQELMTQCNTLISQGQRQADLLRLIGLQLYDIDIADSMSEEALIARLLEVTKGL